MFSAPELDPKLHAPGPKYKLEQPTRVFNIRVSDAMYQAIPKPKQSWTREAIALRLDHEEANK